MTDNLVAKEISLSNHHYDSPLHHLIWDWGAFADTPPTLSQSDQLPSPAPAQVSNCWVLEVPVLKII